MIVDELVTLLDFEVDGLKPADMFRKMLDGIEESSKKAVVGVTGIISAVGFFADKVAKEISANYEWAESMGVASDSYQRLSHAAEVVGGDLDSIKGDMESWVRSAKASGKTLEEVFLSEAKAIEGMTAEQSHAMLTARGYSETAIRMLQQGEGQLKKFLNQAEVIPEKDLKAAKDYARTWNEVSSQVKTTLQSAVASALPALREILESIRLFVQRNKELIKTSVSNFFKGVAKSVRILFSVIEKVIPKIEMVLRLFRKYSDDGKEVERVCNLMLAAFSLIAVSLGVHVSAAIGKAAMLLRNLITAIKMTVVFTKRLYIEIKTRLIPAMIRGSKAVIRFSIAMATKLKTAITQAIVSAVAYGKTLLASVVPAITSAIHATVAWGAAMLANPVGLTIAGIAVAIAAVVGFVYLLVKYWDDLCVLANEAWRITKEFFADAATGAKKLWTEMINVIKVFSQETWNSITGVFTRIWDFVAETGKSVFSGIANFINGIFANAFSAVNSIIRKINKIPGIEISEIKGGGGVVNEMLGVRKPANTIQSGLGDFSSAGRRYATATSNQTSNVSNRSNSVIDNRTITINTNATTGAEVVRELNRTPSVIGAGMGMAGAY